MKDKCILCRQPTEYDSETPIENRTNYIEGCGQLCSDCANGSKIRIKPIKRTPYLKLFLAVILICPVWIAIDTKELYPHQFWWLILITTAYLSLISIIYAGTRRN